MQGTKLDERWVPSSQLEKVESGTSQSKIETSVKLSDSGDRDDVVHSGLHTLPRLRVHHHHLPETIIKHFCWHS